MKPPLGARLRTGHPIARDLEMFFAFNEGGGETVYNHAGTGLYSPSSWGGLEWIATPVGRGVYKASGADSIVIPTPQWSPPLTFFAVFQLSATTSQTGIISWAATDSPTHSGPQLILQRKDADEIQQYDGGAYIATRAGFASGDVVTWTWTVDSADLQSVYYDGTFEASATRSFSRGADWIHLGSGYPNAGAHRVIAFGAWTRVLTAGEVAAKHFDPYTMLRPPPPIELWSAATLGGGAPAPGNPAAAYQYLSMMRGR